MIGVFCVMINTHPLHLQTSFIRYLLGRDFPGQRIGPEPTTDRFVAVMDGTEERVIPGNALTVSPSLPYRGLERCVPFHVRYFLTIVWWCLMSWLATPGLVWPSSIVLKVPSFHQKY